MSDDPPSNGAGSRTRSIMNRIIASSLRQSYLIILMTLLLIGAGSRSLSRLPVDAYPDLSPPLVEVITQWPGRASEEMERLITVPVEREMNGIPQMTTVRSISLYGLSDVILTFENNPATSFARQEVYNRLTELTLPSGVSPCVVSPMSSPSGLISPLCVAEFRPHADGAEDLRGTGLSNRNTNRLPEWRTIQALAGAPCNTRCCSIRPGLPRWDCRCRRWRAR